MRPPNPCPTPTVPEMPPAAPARRDAAALEEVRSRAAGCTACELHLIASRTVFGEGPVDASVMLVGEQPGDREDRTGHPFVGPAGRVLDDALERAEIDRATVYVTNAVKHFRNEPRGKKRIHRKPGLTHIRACEPWLTSEIALVGPQIVVALGATAVQALLTPDVKVLADRGRVFDRPDGTLTLVTVHPSSILRSRGEEQQAAQMAAFVEDLRRVHDAVQR
jgi:uracil-DNA glycosylase family protein